MARRAARRRKQEQNVAELVGRYVLGDAQASIFRSRATPVTIDKTRPDYEFYDKLRRGKAEGYKLGGLFAARIEHIFASWTLGQSLTVKLAESGDPDNLEDPRNYTDGLLADFFGANQTLLTDTEKNKLGLGDQWIIVNADGTLSVPSPDTVDVRRNPLDYRLVEAVTVTTKLESVTIVDEYRADGRTVTIKSMVNGQQREIVQNYQNLIGRIPVVHLAHGMSGNETNGHSIHEQLLPLYDQYDDTIYKQLDGAKLLGNPLLAFVGMEDITEVINANEPLAPETYADLDGNIVERPQLNIDRNAILLIGKGGDAKFVSPPVGFSEDTTQSLKSLFLMLLDHTGIPEFIWGNELSSARASAEIQMTQWARDIEARRQGDELWILDLADIWLLTTALVDPRVVLDELEAEWPPVLERDDAMLLRKIESAWSKNLLQAVTALTLLDLVPDAADEVQKAELQAEAREQAAMDKQIQLNKATAQPKPAIGEMSSRETGAIIQAAAEIIAEGNYGA